MMKYFYNYVFHVNINQIGKIPIRSTLYSNLIKNFGNKKVINKLSYQ